MKVLKLIAIAPLVLLSANTFAQGRQQGSRNDWDSYESRNSYSDRGRGYDSGYGDRDRYRSSGRRYTGSRYSYSYGARPVYYPRVRPGLRVGLYDDYGYASYGYGGYEPYGYYPPVRYQVYRPAPILSLRLNLGGRGGHGRRR